MSKAKELGKEGAIHMKNKENPANQLSKDSDKRLEAFLRRRSRYRVPKQDTAFPYTELRQANLKNEKAKE